MEVPKRAKNLMGLVTGLVNKIKTMHFKSQCNFTGHLSIYLSIIQSRNYQISVLVLEYSLNEKNSRTNLKKKKKNIQMFLSMIYRDYNACNIKN